MDSISVEEKRQALERVLASRTFGRSDQLRSFLRYICEAEFDGRAQEINEYTLGVTVLGRRSDYNPAEDSCVRSRAYELRHKLSSYYQAEAPHDPVQIEIHKGGYVPRFERRNGNGLNRHFENGEHTSPPSHDAPARNRYLVVASAFAGLLAILIASVSLYWLRSATSKPVSGDPPRPALTPELASLWKPFLDNSAPLLISFETRLFFYSPATGLVVRDYQTNRSQDLAHSKPLQLFEARMATRDLRENFDYADSGSIHAVFLLGRFLTQQGREADVKHADSLGWEDLRNDNIIFIGKPNLNPSIQYVLQQADFVDDEGTVRNLHPLPGEPASYASAMTHGQGEKYALITVLPAPQPGHTIMVLDGAGSELMWALAAAVTDPAYAKEIVSHLRLPSGQSPQAFQVVIAATFESYVPVRIRYVTHRISRMPQP